MFGFKRRRRSRLRQRPFPAAWHTTIERLVPYFHLLAPAEQAELLGHTQVLLAEKPFEGCGGLTITDEVRVTIAAQAAVLLLNRPADYYPKLGTILVYPDTYLVEATRPQPDGTVVEGPEARAGESWLHGAVVLSWADVQHTALGVHDGLNVVFHEFAHQLDAESGSMEGAPRLASSAQYADWARVLGRFFNELRADLEHRRPPVLRPYAATSPPEFFAVATEAFFETPDMLRRRAPDLYDELRGYFHQDPAQRFPVVAPVSDR